MSQDPEKLKDYETVNNIDGSFRIIDKKTRFQSNHITSRKEGEWCDVLLEEQKEEEMKVASDWLNKYGLSL